MVDPQPGPDLPADEALTRRRLAPPRVGAWAYGPRMALAVTVAALLTAVLVGLALVLDAHARSWLGPVVFVLGVVTVIFYCWAIYTTVQREAALKSRPNGPGDDTIGFGEASRGVSPR